MKALITYLSQTGNTKKVAETIYNEIICDKDIMEMKDVNCVEGYDIIFAGFPVWQSGPAEPAANFLNAHSLKVKFALFVTHSMPYEAETHDEQKLLTSVLNKCRGCVADENLSGFFHCRGELAGNIAEFLLKSNDQRLIQFGKSRENTVGHPDEDELEVARIFARDVMSRLL